MKQVLVDTNVLISFLTDRNAHQRERAAELLRAAAAQEHTLVLHSMTIVEIINVLTQLYHEDPQDVAEDVADLLAMPGVVSTEDVAWSQVLDLWPRPIPSLGDAILAAAASQGSFDAVATFDRGLTKNLARQGTSLFWPIPRGT